MAEGGFDFKKFIDESKATLLTPAEYFAAMPKEGGFADPLVKAVIYSLVAGIITFIWGVFHLIPIGGAMGGLLGGGVGIAGLVTAIIGGIIGLFIAGAIILVISAICGGNTNYETNVRVAASIMVLSPINALLGFLSSVSLWLGGLVSLAMALYGLYMLYIAVTKTLGGKEGTAKIISIILAVIPVLMIMSTLLCVKAVSTLPENMMKNMPVQNQEQLDKLTDEFNKALQEADKLKDEGVKEGEE